MRFPRVAILLAPSLMVGSLACTVTRSEPASQTAATMPPPPPPAEIAPAPAPPPPVTATPASPMPPPVATTPAPSSTAVASAGTTAPSGGITKVGSAGSSTSPAPSTGTKVASGASVCAVDADCKMVTQMCNSCACNAVLKDVATPKCAGGKSVQCFADPCMKKKAACVSGACAIVSTNPAM